MGMNRWDDAVYLRQEWVEFKYKYPGFISIHNDNGIHMSVQEFLKIPDSDIIAIPRDDSEYPMKLETAWRHTPFFCLLDDDDMQVWVEEGREGLVRWKRRGELL